MEVSNSQNGHAASGDETMVAAIVREVMRALPAPSSETKPVAAEGPMTRLSEFAPGLEAIWGNPQQQKGLYETVQRSIRAVLLANDLPVPTLEEVAALIAGYTQKTKGGTVARAFWWGFHVQISHEDLAAFVGGAGAVNSIVDLIGGSIPSPAQPFIKLAATFIAASLGLLKSLDRGRGVYISMSWFAPGIFVPTSVV